MEDECFPAIPLNAACERLTKEAITIKDEPISETDSTHSSCPSSPQSSFMNTSELHFDVDMVKPPPLEPPLLHCCTFRKTPSPY
jgi:hypothetical protein